ncbi:MAG: translation initiation factor IF-2 [archaeon]
MVDAACFRSPIVSVLGHVDHGKSSVLDAIRGTNIVKTEAGQITQAIGASIIPLDVIMKRCSKLLKDKPSFSIPGLLFIDTPGHAAFMGMRKRGGNLADIAILIVDINEGFKPQTIESIKILRSQKTPFVVALNKMDLIANYRKQADLLMDDIQQQRADVQQTLDNKLYTIVGQFYEQFELQAERYDRCDFTKQVALVPCSAKQDIGIAELLMVLIGLTQKYLQESLAFSAQGPAKGSVMEVKESPGLGTCMNVILYDGSLAVNDTIVIGGIDKPTVTKVRALFEPYPLHEMRDKKSKYKSVEHVCAATGVRIAAAQDVDAVIAGMPLMSCEDTPEAIAEAEQQLQETFEELPLEKEGIIIKADTLGSLEALAVLLKENAIPVRAATIGAVSKKDIADAESEQEPTFRVILGFNVKDESGLQSVKVITNDVIYRLIDDVEQWQQSVKEKEEERALDLMTRPCKLEVLQNCIFRQSNPAVVGVEVLVGVLQKGMPLMKNGQRLCIVKSMQKEKENIDRAEKKDQIAISLPDVVCGRHLFEGDVLYSDIPEEQFRELKKFKKHLARDELDLMKEIAEFHRKDNPVWGI